MRLLRYEPALAERVYIAPKGTDPGLYMRTLAAQAESLIRENNLHPALTLLQKRLAVVSHYRGSRTTHAAQAMAGLARVATKMGMKQDARTWAHYAMRTYAALMVDAETRNKPGIMECMAALHEAFPDAMILDDAERTGAPDFTTGTLVRSGRG